MERKIPFKLNIILFLFICLIVIVACETGNLGSDKVQKMNGCNDFYEVDIFTVIKKGSQHSKVNVCGIEENLT